MKHGALDEAPALSDAEIEAILAEENALPPESCQPPQAHHLAETTVGVAPWVKWVLLIALGSEFLLGMLRLFNA